MARPQIQQLENQPHFRRESDIDNRWHLDKSLPLSIIGALLIQAVSGVWFASKLTQEVSVHGDAITAIQLDIKDNEKIRSDIESRLASMDQGIRDIRDMMFQQPARPSQIIMGTPAQSQQPSTQIIVPQQMPSGEPPSRSPR